MVNKGNKNTSAKKQMATLKNQVARKLNGARIRVSPNPTPTTRIPWNQCTVVLISDGQATDYLISDLHKALKTQINIEATFEMKISKVRAWGFLIPAEGTQNLIIAPADLSDDDLGQYEPMVVLRDAGTVSSRPAVGYEWPASQRAQVIVTSETNASKFLETSNATLVYVDVLWKPRFVGSRTITKDYVVPSIATREE